MGAAGVELPNFITRDSVEWAHGQSVRAQRSQRTGLFLAGMRAARARDPLLMKTLDASAEILQQISAEQADSNTLDCGARIDATEFSLWREAYRSADEGEPMAQFGWIYGAAALLSGLAA